MFSPKQQSGSLFCVTWNPEQIVLISLTYLRKSPLNELLQCFQQAYIVRWAALQIDHRRITDMSTAFSVGQVVGFISVSVLLLFIFTKLVSCHTCSHVKDGYGYAVLITGCDSGFGHQLARCLDQKGFVVFAGCLFPQGKGAQDLARQSSGNLKILKLDVTSDEEVQQVKKTVQENLPEKGETSTRCKKSPTFFCNQL